jgi:hypothetical protein
MARRSKVSIKAEHRLGKHNPFALHGARILPNVEVTSYNLELSEHDKFVGDRANKASLLDLIDKWRRIVKRNGRDPLRKYPKGKISKSDMAALLTEGETDAAGVVQSALNEFSGRLAKVIEKYIQRVPEWRGVKLVLIGGGLSGSKIGRIAIGRAQAILAKGNRGIVLRQIASHPDDAALIGGVHLLPSWFLKGFDAILAVDIGGSNVRLGVVKFKLDRKLQVRKAAVVFRKRWSYAEEDPTRDAILEFIAAGLQRAVAWCRRHKLKPAPFVGVACPGRVRADGTVDRGAQNLPGKWGAGSGSLASYIRNNVNVQPTQDTVVVMHNDAVAHGLSELPAVKMGEWAVLTIGTGLGNATFKKRKWNRMHAK